VAPPPEKAASPARMAGSRALPQQPEGHNDNLVFGSVEDEAMTNGKATQPDL